MSRNSVHVCTQLYHTPAQPQHLSAQGQPHMSQAQRMHSARQATPPSVAGSTLLCVCVVLGTCNTDMSTQPQMVNYPR
jgi:hypothetical protein